MINQRTKKHIKTGGSLRSWLSAKKRHTQARLGRLIPAVTPERELWAANLTGRMTILAELEVVIAQKAAESTEREQRLEGEDE